MNAASPTLLRTEGAVATFIGQLDALSTFGLFDGTQLANALLQSGSFNWNALMQKDFHLTSAYSNAPILLITCTMDVNGSLWITQNKEVLRFLLLHVPTNVLKVVCAIPWDPIVTNSAIWNRVRPLSETEDSKKSCKSQCAPLELAEIRRQWTDFIQSLIPFGHMVLTTTTVFACVPSLILNHKWQPDKNLMNLKHADQRRQSFVREFILPNFPNLKHCISWLALDAKHVTEQSVLAPTHLDIPLLETQFINTLILQQQ